MLCSFSVAVRDIQGQHSHAVLGFQDVCLTPKTLFRIFFAAVKNQTVVEKAKPIPSLQLPTPRQAATEVTQYLMDWARGPATPFGQPYFAWEKGERYLHLQGLTAAQ